MRYKTLPLIVKKVDTNTAPMNAYLKLIGLSLRIESLSVICNLSSGERSGYADVRFG